MGTSKTTAQFVNKINKVGEATDRHRKAAVNDGAMQAKKVMLAAATTAGLTPGGKIANRKWNVRYDIKGTELPVALVRFTGPVHLVNSPTKSHYIAAKGLGGSRRGRGEQAFQASAARFSGGSSRGSFDRASRGRGKKALSFNGRARAYVFHPGTNGKRFFPAAKALAERTVPDVMAKSMKGTWHKVLS